MQIRRYESTDVRSAMAAIRNELGPEAVILSNEPRGEGVEVIAAVDYDETLWERNAAEELKLDDPETTFASMAEPTSRYAALAADSEQVSAPAEPPIPNPSLSLELNEMRQLLENHLAALAWNDLNRNSPAKGRALRQLRRLALDTDVANLIGDQMPEVRDIREAWRLPLKLLAAEIPTARFDIAEGGILALVGPTGVGKTTTIAKLASRFALKNRVRDMALITTDNFRIGAREQLLTFARILGVPMHVTENTRELRQRLEALQDKKLVLIDTAGMGPGDLRLATQFGMLRSEGIAVKTLLTLSAASDSGALRRAVDGFRDSQPVGFVFTKLDEAASLGPALSTLVRTQLPAYYFTDGQRVPEDLQAAAGKEGWLLRLALSLAGSHGEALDEQRLALDFGAREVAGRA